MIHLFKKLPLFSLGEDVFKGGYFAVFAMYAALSAYLFLNFKALVPDEFWFFDISSKTAYFDLYKDVTYGPMFWSLLKLVADPFLLRLIFFIFWISSVVLILSIFDLYKHKLLVLLLWISMPAAYWVGKLIGPEVLVLFLVSLSCYLIFKKSQFNYAAILLGFSSGVLITSIPCALLLLLSKFTFRKYVSIFVLFCFGLWLSNPLTLVDYLRLLFGSSGLVQSVDVDSVVKLKAMLSGHWLHWDNIYKGSFSSFIVALISFVLIMASLLILRPGLSILFGLIVVFTGFIIFKSSVPQGYYWMFCAPIFLVAFGYSWVYLEASSRKGLLIVMLLLALSVNFYKQFHFIVFQIGQKSQQIDAIKGFNHQCVAEIMSKYRPDSLISKLDFGIDQTKLPEVPGYQGSYNSKMVDGRVMLLISGRLISNPYHFDSLNLWGKPLYYVAYCKDVFIFASQP